MTVTLGVISLNLPPLRHHTEDIKEIILYHSNKICSKLNIEEKGFSPGFVNNLCVYNWPGNIRELINSLEGAISMAQNEPILFPKHLPDNIRIQVIRSNVDHRKNQSPPELQAYSVERNNSNRRSEQNDFSNVDLLSKRVDKDSATKILETREKTLEKADIMYLKTLMIHTQGNIKESCQISGLGRTRLYTLLKKYNISRHGWSSNSRSSRL